MGDIFGGKANTNYVRMNKRVVYHRFTAFMTKRSLSREEACIKWAILPEHEKEKYAHVASELGEVGDKHKSSLMEKIAAFKGTLPLGSKNAPACYFLGVCWENGEFVSVYLDRQ